MDVFIKVSAGVLIALVLTLVLDKQEKHISIVLSLSVCCMVIAGAVTFLEPVTDFFSHLQDVANLDARMLSVLLKSVGIGLLGEITALICSDAGNAAMGKALQLMSTAVILWLSIPLFTALLDLVEKILVAT